MKRTIRATTGALAVLAFLAAIVYLASPAQAAFDEIKLTASDGSSGDQFGWQVAISGNLAIVGAPFDDIPGINSGSAYLFNASTGQEIFKLEASDAISGAEFGRSVAVSGNTAV
ncbi:MAG: hypothetical protein WD873_00675, partial [Candidatus Hydrogenedentales bacterium]